MEKDNLLLQHIMDFHIHPVDSFTDEQEPRSQFPETSNRQEAPGGQPWRRHSAGAIILADKASRKSQLLHDVPLPLPLNRLWLQDPKLDPFVHYPVRNPAGRVLNLEKACSHSRPRVPDIKAIHRLNISPVRNEPNQRHIPKLFIPPRTHCVRVTGQGNRVSSEETKKIEPNLTVSQFSDYSNLSDIRNLRSDKGRNRDPRPARDSLVGKSHDVSNSQASSKNSDRTGMEMSVVTISADAVLRKVKCSREVLCDPRKIATQHLQNCLVTYIPEDGSRFVTYISDDILQTDAQNKEFGKQIVSGQNNKLYADSSFGVDEQPTNINKMHQETEAKESELNLDDSNQVRPAPKFISQKSIVNSRRAPIKSLTSIAIPIDTPDLKPVCATTSSQIPNTQTKSKFFRRKETARHFSNCPSYAPSFPDSTIMAHFPAAVRAQGNFKFNRVWTNHQKSYVTDPVADFRKEVKNIMQTSQGYLKPRLVQTPGGHPKVIACHISNNQSTSHAAARYVEDRNKSRLIEPAQMRLSKGKNYAVVLPNVHRMSGHESAPIYVMSSTSTPLRCRQNEVDA